MSATSSSIDPAIVADALRMNLISPDEAARFLYPDQRPDPPADAELCWRVSYWRSARPEPSREVFATLAGARTFANKAAHYSPNGPGGRVTKIEIEECLLRRWALVDDRDLLAEPDDARASSAPEVSELEPAEIHDEPDPEGGQSTMEETP